MERSYKDERDIVDFAASQEDGSVHFLSHVSDRGSRLLDALRGNNLAHRERPDFEDATRRFLLEVMIVDDHPRKKSGDATRAREAALQREVEAAGFDVIAPNAKLSVRANTGLPTDEDHNFRAYVDHFEQVVSKHASNVDHYRAERPGYDLAFVLFDESTAYFETMGAFGRDGRGRPHLHFADRKLLTILKNTGVDCVAWITPWKYLSTDAASFPLPRLTIIDLADVNPVDHERYDAMRMRSAER